jgi:8-oxo-dGTP pyrophosphatase MutT (NUDIX family)
MWNLVMSWQMTAATTGAANRLHSRRCVSAQGHLGGGVAGAVAELSERQALGGARTAAAAREAREELGITIDPADLAFAHLCHHADPDGLARVGVFFAARRWTGGPVNAEPHKCSEIAWHATGELPSDIVSYIRTGLNAYSAGGVQP